MKRFEVSGHVDPAFEEVRNAFVNNFENGKELGAACCINVDGKKWRLLTIRGRGLNGAASPEARCDSVTLCDPA